MRDKPRDGHLQLSEAGALIKARGDIPKEYHLSDPSTTPPYILQLISII